MAEKTLRIALTGAAGQVAYPLIFSIASGAVFGPDTLIDLSLIDLPVAASKLEGVRMELEDCAFPSLRSVTLAVDPIRGFEGCNWALLVGAMPRREGMQRKDLLAVNAPVFIEQGLALSRGAARDCRVLVVGNPCNTNAYVARAVCRGLDPRNFYALTMLDQNRAVGALAKKTGRGAGEIKNVVIWGNHSNTQCPDITHAVISGRPAAEVVNDPAWIEGDFIRGVQDRGAQVIKARGSSSAASAAQGVADTLRAIVRPTPRGEFFSLALPSDGSYAIPEGLVFSFPVRSTGSDVSIVADLSLSDSVRRRIEATTAELLEEKSAVDRLLEPYRS